MSTASPRECRSSAVRLLELQQAPRGAAENLLLVTGVESEFVDHVEPALLQSDQLRRVGAEDHAVGTDGLNGAFDRRRVVGDRIEINPAQIFARLARDVDRRTIGAED